jgi:putative flavoprotein involved in K+ transport
VLQASLPHTRPSAWRLERDATEVDGARRSLASLRHRVGRGRGVLRLRDGRAWILMTMLVELQGHEEPVGDRRPRASSTACTGRGSSPGSNGARPTRPSSGITRDPYCLIVGGGQGGIGLAARLKRLSVPTLVIDRHARPGDAWRSRYKSLVSA